MSARTKLGSAVQARRRVRKSLYCDLSGFAMQVNETGGAERQCVSAGWLLPQLPQKGDAGRDCRR